MVPWYWIPVAFMVGGFLGVLAMAMCNMAKD